MMNDLLILILAAYILGYCIGRILKMQGQQDLNTYKVGTRFYICKSKREAVALDNQLHHMGYR